jgi:hypothetical protein
VCFAGDITAMLVAIKPTNIIKLAFIGIN